MRLKKAMSRILLILLLIGIGGSGILIFTGMSDKAAKDLKVQYLGVGYGSSAFLEFPGGRNLLIDSGDETSGKRIAVILKNKGIKKIDTVIISHDHPDHAGGLRSILSGFRVNKLITSSETVRGGMQIEGYGQAKIVVLSAGNNNDNDSSMVLKVSYMDKSFLFPSDIGNAVCDELVKKYGRAINCDVISIPHHGKSSTPGFVKAVSPELAVVSTGDSLWGGPDENIMKMYEEQGAKVLRTDKAGTIEVITDGNKLWY